MKINELTLPAQLSELDRVVRSALKGGRLLVPDDHVAVPNESMQPDTIRALGLAAEQASAALERLAARG